MYPNQPQPGQFGGGPSMYQPQRQGCLGRNWKWIVPVGCLGLIVLVVAAAAVIFFFVISAVKSSEIYQRAFEKARNNQAVIAELGQPVSDGWLVIGSVETTRGGDGHAKFQFPVSGPKNSGTVYVDALKVRDLYPDGDWHFQNLEVEIKGRPERINLLQGEDEDMGGVTYTAPPPPPLSLPTPMASASNRPTVSGGVLNDKAISKPPPAYPAIAKAAKASGAVTVQVVIDEEGKVISASAVSGHPLLRAAAVEAARQARFAPYKLNGQPFKVTGILTYNFVLE
ncbi:MAG TPA: cytochrome c oxidase assembly factor Coa1 family protein [Pyrinomonadaceae bacterium]|nr:cytochrome c oxidase assembly factor Coa1 family protein [Pyrinomonadaceae bacterium]